MIRSFTKSAAITLTATLLVALPASADPIGQVAAGNPALSTFMMLVRAAGMEQSLDAPGPLTVFAPSNEAFDRLPFVQFQALQAPENLPRLRALISYHIVPRVQLMMLGQDGIMNLPTTGGGSLTLQRDNNANIRINGGSRLVWSNLRADNGRLNVIDTVLIP